MKGVVTVPPAVVRLTLPLAAAVAGTRTTTLVAVLLMILAKALAPLMVSAVTLLRVVPVRVMLWPSPPGLGVTAVIVGAATWFRRTVTVLKLPVTMSRSPSASKSPSAMLWEELVEMERVPP